MSTGEAGDVVPIAEETKVAEEKTVPPPRPSTFSIVDALLSGMARQPGVQQCSAPQPTLNWYDAPNNDEELQAHKLSLGDQGEVVGGFENLRQMRNRFIKENVKRYHSLRFTIPFDSRLKQLQCAVAGEYWMPGPQGLVLAYVSLNTGPGYEGYPCDSLVYECCGVFTEFKLRRDEWRWVLNRAEANAE